MTKEYYEAHRAERAAYARAARKADPEKFAARARLYRERNRDRLNAADRARYVANPETARSRWREWRRENGAAKDAKRRAAWIKWLHAIKSRPCVDCGRQLTPSKMEFDHVPERGAKLFGIADGRDRSRKAVMLEIEKCDLVCVRCHHKRTVARGQNCRKLVA